MPLVGVDAAEAAADADESVAVSAADPPPTDSRPNLSAEDALNIVNTFAASISESSSPRNISSLLSMLVADISIAAAASDEVLEAKMDEVVDAIDGDDADPAASCKRLLKKGNSFGEGLFEFLFFSVRA